jgi:perosamine synthetase
LKKKYNIPISKPYFDKEDYKNLVKPLESGWVVQGKYVEEFERLFSELTGIKYSAAVTSCTTALHLAVIVKNLKQGEEVIVPGFTWISTPNTVEYVRGTPVFCDIDLDTFNIDINDAGRRITGKTKGIIPVHLFGLCADMDAVNKLAKENNLWVVEDAACAYNGFYKKKHAGNFGNTSCFSFHPRKSVTTGEGGIVASGSRKEIERVKELRNIGASVSDYNRNNKRKSFLLPEYKLLGYNYRMTDIQAAVGVSQLKKSASLVESRIRVAELYNEILKKETWLQLPFKNKDYKHGYQSYVCLYNPINLSSKDLMKNNRWKIFHEQRNSVMLKLEKMGISTRQGTHSACHQEYYVKKYKIKPVDYPNSFLADKLSIALPLFTGITKKEIEIVTESLIKEFKKIR